MNYTLEIQNILEKPQHFLMGAGQYTAEYISLLISVAKPYIYYTPPTDGITVKRQWFYKVLMSMMSLTKTTSSELVYNLEEMLKKHTDSAVYPSSYSNSPLSIDSSIEQVKLFLKTTDKLQLLPQSIINNSYFNKNNTYYIFTDKYEWYEYMANIEYSTTWQTVVPITNFDWVIQFRKSFNILQGISTSAYDRLFELVKTKNLISLKEGYIVYLQLVSPDYDLTDYLDTPLIDLFNRYKLLLPTKYEEYKNKIAEMNFMNNVNVIEYSKLFNPDYLQTMFTITDDRFYTALIEWKNNNTVGHTVGHNYYLEKMINDV